MLLAQGCTALWPPARPENLDATALSAHEIELTWTCDDEEPWYDTDAPYVDYAVYRDGRVVAYNGDLGYIDGGLAPDTQYCYRVRSYWADNFYDWIFPLESGKSNEACARTYPLGSVSGTVTLDGAGLAGVLVEISASLSGQPLAGTTTGPAGQYAFPDLEENGYLITPTLAGYTFSPDYRSVQIRYWDVSGQDFTAVPEP